MNSYEELVSEIKKVITERGFVHLRSLYEKLLKEDIDDMPETVYTRHLELIDELKSLLNIG